MFFARLKRHYFSRGFCFLNYIGGFVWALPYIQKCVEQCCLQFPAMIRHSIQERRDLLKDLNMNAFQKEILQTNCFQ